MNGSLARTLVVVMLIAAVAASGQEEDGLFPQREPLRTATLAVNAPHVITYELSGNPDGAPVFVLHGGPGAGCYPRMRRYFDPEHWLVVLHDQRGAGRSTPYGELDLNSTEHLIADIEALRENLGFERILLFGGSWGSTLALAYAEAHPDRVSGLILRGVFLGTEREIEQHYLGNATFYPEEHARLQALLPDPARGTHPDYLHELITGDDPDLACAVIEALGRYELKFMKLLMRGEWIDGWMENPCDEQHAKYVGLDLHYVTHRYFLEPDQLMRDVDRIAHLPAILVHGRYDMACPPASAWRLHRALPKSQLVIVEEAGHSETEDGITRALVEATESFRSGFDGTAD